jgi:transcriptional regulator with XRE-family HTH domain
MNVASSLLKQARRSSGASTRGLARLAHIAPARVSEIEGSVHDPGVSTLDHAVRALGWQVTVLPTRAPSAAAVAVSIRDAATSSPASETDSALRSLLALSDGLAASDAAVRIALCAAPPPPTGDARIDAAIAAVAEYHLEAAGVLPEWVNAPDRVLDDAWVPDPYAGPNIAEESPPAFQRHNVLLAERELSSV